MKANQTFHQQDDEAFDDGLRKVMGGRYDDGAAQKQVPEMESIPRTPASEKAERASDAKCVPAAQYVPSFMDRLGACAKWSMIFGGLTFLLFYWQEAGLMDPAAAVPSMCVCTCLGGFKIGGICRRSQYGNH